MDFYLLTKFAILYIYVIVVKFLNYWFFNDIKEI